MFTCKSISFLQLQSFYYKSNSPGLTNNNYINLMSFKGYALQQLIFQALDFLRNFTHGTVQSRLAPVVNDTLWSKPGIPDLSHFTSCALLLYVGVCCKSVQSSEAGHKKHTSDSLNKFFPLPGMFMWLEQGILRGLGVFIPQVRGIPVNTTVITQDSDNPLLQRNKKWSIF